MKILFVIRDMVVGGAGKQLALTANALSSYSHKVSVFTYMGGDSCHKLNNEVDYIPQNPIPKTKLSEYIFSIQNIRKQIKELKPDIVISWRCNAGCFSVLAALGLKAKVIFSERSDPYLETSFLLKISAFVCGFSFGGVFQTEAVRAYYKRLSKKSVVIHNPVDEKLIRHDFISYHSRRNEIVHVARMNIVQKRQDVMLDAFEIFHKKHPDYTLSFYGDGPDINQIKQKVIDANLSNSVFFWGAEKNVVNKIRFAKMLVLTSDYEGIPNVVLEAFSAGVPVVSTNCSPGGAKVLIDNGVNGFITPVHDPISIAEKMDEIANSEELFTQFVSEGEKKTQAFLPDEIFSAWNKYLSNLAL